MDGLEFGAIRKRVFSDIIYTFADNQVFYVLTTNECVVFNPLYLIFVSVVYYCVRNDECVIRQ